MIYDRTLYEIRERSSLDLLDLALLVLRARPRELVLAAVVGIAPWAALNYWLLNNPDFPPVFWAALLVLETPWATAPLTLVMGEIMFRRRLASAKLQKTLFSSLPALFLTNVVVRGLLVAFVFMYPVMPAQYGFIDEVILLERESAWRVFRRARQLSSGCEGELFLRWITQISLGTIFALCFWMCAQTLTGALAGEELTWYRPGSSDLAGLFFQAGVWIAIAFFAVFRFLSYIDRRIRLEGWALALALKGVGRTIEEKLH
jgi:hypothetical protein